MFPQFKTGWGMPRKHGFLSSVKNTRGTDVCQKKHMTNHRFSCFPYRDLPKSGAIQ